MKIMVDFATHGYLIEFSPFLGTNIEIYQKSFEKWYYEETKYGTLQQRSDLKYTSFGIDVIIDWINEVAPSANPVILQRDISFCDIDRTIPELCF